MAQETPTPPLGDVINTLLQNPAVLSAISSLRQNPKGTETPTAVAEEAPLPKVEAPPMETSGAVEDKIPEIVNTIAPLLSASRKSSSAPHSDRRSALLCALKPYLCRERCDAIDTMLKIGSLTELLKNLH